VIANLPTRIANVSATTTTDDDELLNDNAFVVVVGVVGVIVVDCDVVGIVVECAVVVDD
jgi:hypothetical protein